MTKRNKMLEFVEDFDAGDRLDRDIHDVRNKIHRTLVLHRIPV